MLIELQSFVSFPDSIPALQSKAAWELGYESYFTQNMPIPNALDPKIAVAIARQVEAHFQASRASDVTSTWNVLLLQAEAGVIAPLILTELAQSPIFPYLQLHLMDTRAALVEKWAQLDQLTPDSGKMTLHSAFSLEKPIAWPVCPDMVITDRSLSWLPCRHIQVVDGKAFDTVRRTLGSPDQSLLEFEVGKLRFIPENGYNPSEIIGIQQLIKTMDLKEGLLNYSAAMLSLIQQVLHAMPAHGLFVCIDIGDLTLENNPNIEKLEVQRGRLNQNKLPILLLEAHLRQLGWTPQAHELSKYSLWVVQAYQGQTPPQKLSLPDSHTEQSIETLDKMTDSGRFVRQLELLEKDWLDKEEKNYVLNYRIARSLLERNLIDKGIKYLKKNILHYGDFAATSLLLLGRIRRVYGQYEVAELILKRAQKLMGNYPPVLQELVQLYLTEHQFDHAMEAILAMIQKGGQSVSQQRALIEQVLNHNFTHPKRLLLEKTLEQL